MAELKVSIVEFVDEYNPGIVAAELVDAGARNHRMIDKVPLFTEKMLDAHSAYREIQRNVSWLTGGGMIEARS